MPHCHAATVNQLTEDECHNYVTIATDQLSPYTDDIKVQLFCNLQQMRYLFWLATKLHAQRNNALVMYWRQDAYH